MWWGLSAERGLWDFSFLCCSLVGLMFLILIESGSLTRGLTEHALIRELKADAAASCAVVVVLGPEESLLLGLLITQGSLDAAECCRPRLADWLTAGVSCGSVSSTGGRLRADLVVLSEADEPLSAGLPVFDDDEDDSSLTFGLRGLSDDSLEEGVSVSSWSNRRFILAISSTLFLGLFKPTGPE